MLVRASPARGPSAGGAVRSRTWGRPDGPERVAEVRWETVVPAGRIAQVVQAYVDAHPYEEPAFDVYPVEDVRPRTGVRPRGAGAGDHVPAGPRERGAAECFGMSEAVYAGDPERQVERVAVVTGSGTSLMAAGRRRSPTC